MIPANRYQYPKPRFAAAVCLVLCRGGCRRERLRLCRRFMAGHQRRLGIGVGDLLRHRLVLHVGLRRHLPVERRAVDAAQPLRDLVIVCRSLLPDDVVLRRRRRLRRGPRGTGQRGRLPYGSSRARCRRRPSESPSRPSRVRRAPTVRPATGRGAYCSGVAARGGGLMWMPPAR